MGICYCPLGPKASVPETTNNFFWLMLSAQIGQSVVFKTPTKLQHPYCNSYEAIAIAKLDLVLDRRNVSLFRDLATEPIFTLRISPHSNISQTPTKSCYYRGFKSKPGDKKGYSIVIASNRRYGLKWLFGMLGSILDLTMVRLKSAGVGPQTECVHV